MEKLFKQKPKAVSVNLTICRVEVCISSKHLLNDDKICAASCENLQVDLGIFHFLPVLSQGKSSFTLYF